MSAESYWDGVAREWGGARRPSTWRLFCDTLNVRGLGPWLADTPPAGAPALKTDLFDEAYGSRALSDWLASHAQGLVGLDISKETCRLAQRRQGLTALYAGDVRRLPHRDATFGIILSNSTLDHLESLADVSIALRELHRVLKPGGRLLLTMDNFANPLVALRNSLPHTILSALRLVPYRMGATCGPRQLRRMLVAAGFDVRAMRSLMHVPRLPAVAAASGIDRLGGGPAAASVFSAVCHSFEWLDALPTRYLTGYFIAALAERR